MASAREMRLRIRSIKNISQVTRALEAVSASRVRRAVQAVEATRPYAEKAWNVLAHLARQPGHNSLHPLLTERTDIKRVLVLMLSGDRGLAGAYNVNIVRFTLQHFLDYPTPVQYITVGRKGRDMLVRRRRDVVAEFSHLPSPPSFMDTSAIGRILIDDFLNGAADQIYLSYTDYRSMVTQIPTLMKLLPLEVEVDPNQPRSIGVFSYEPDQNEILDLILQRFVSIQVYKAILSAQASEHAARMIAMRNATENASELAGALQLEYNKARQQAITNDMLDIVGGAEALAKSRAT